MEHECFATIPIVARAREIKFMHFSHFIDEFTGSMVHKGLPLVYDFKFEKIELWVKDNHPFFDLSSFN
jgi:hypothetical protein